MGGQQKDFISDIVFFQHQDEMRLKVRRHFLQCTHSPGGEGDNRSEDARHWIGLLQYNPSTLSSIPLYLSFFLSLSSFLTSLTESFTFF
jgi:hypothetical protein